MVNSKEDVDIATLRVVFAAVVLHALIGREQNFASRDDNVSCALGYADKLLSELPK